MNIKLSDEFIALNPHWTRREQQLILKSLLNKINLTSHRSDYVYLKIRGFGTIKSHGNKKKLNQLKKWKRLNKKRTLKKQQLREKTASFLLF